MKLFRIINGQARDFKNVNNKFIEDESSALNEAVRGDRTLTVKFRTNIPETFVPFQTYGTMDEGGERFYLTKAPTVTKINESNYEFEMELESVGNLLKYYIFTDKTDERTRERVSFSITGTPEDFVAFIARNCTAAINRAGIPDAFADWDNPGTDDWNDCGYIIPEDTKTVTFDSNTIREALDMIADAFETEWEIKRNSGGKYEVHLNRVETTAIPLELKYGAGNGLLSGVKLGDDGDDIKRLWVTGGERNVNFDGYLYPYASQYRQIVSSEKLLLPTMSLRPVGATEDFYKIKFDGENFGPFTYRRGGVEWDVDAETGERTKIWATKDLFIFAADPDFDEGKSRTYKIDKNGAWIEDEETSSRKEARYENSEIYPSKELQADGFILTGRVSKQQANGETLITYPNQQVSDGIWAITVNKKQLYTQKKEGGVRFYSKIQQIEKRYESGYIERYYKLMPEDLLGTYMFQKGQAFGVVLEYEPKTSTYRDGYCKAKLYTAVKGNGQRFEEVWLPIDDVSKTGETFPDYQKCTTDGETPKIVFQEGMLAGREFENAQVNGVYFEQDETKATFYLKVTTFDTVEMPQNDQDEGWQEVCGTTAAFAPKIGEKFAVFGVTLPNEYLAEAEVRLLKDAVRYLYENGRAKKTISGKLDAIAMAQNFTESERYNIRLGGIIDFTDEGMTGGEAIRTRITAIKTPTRKRNDKEITFESGRIRESLGKRLKRMNRQ